MTSGIFEIIPVRDIIVNRDDRQRRELKNIDELAESIRVNGLINPIVVTRDLELVAGERRLTAHQLLEYDSIAVQYAEDLDEIQLHIIELEENIRREDLTWQDHVNAVARYHEIKKTQAATINEEWSQENTAEELNMSQASINRHLLIKRAMDAGVAEVLDAPKFSTAANFAQRRQERQKTSVLRELREPVKIVESRVGEEGQLIMEEVVPQGDRFADIKEANFLDWSKNVQETPFNFIHCDFPYGVSAGDTSGQSGAKNFGGYADGADIYFNLLETFCNNLDNYCAPTAHLIFWFSMDYFSETRDQLRAAGWSITPFPLVWFKSDNTGILPDANRGPRRVYETAFFGYRGDRKVVRAVGNAVGAGVTKKYHMSEKPEIVLEHFFRMIVDETTVMLDPTCGSGNAVKVAEARGASWSLGLELNPDYVKDARQNLELD